MPRGKKKVASDDISKKDMRATFVNCKAFTQDQVKAAIVELCRRSDIPDETTREFTNTIETVVSNSFSKIMASSGL